MEPTQASKVYEIEPEKVCIRPDRHRQLFTRKPLEELIDSMRAVGQLQPGVCCINGLNEVELIMGERRLKACSFLKLPFHYCLSNELDPLLLEQMQLDENLCREDLSWQEEVRAKERLHSIFQERFGAGRPGFSGGHSLKDTAEHIGIAKTSLLDDIALAKLLSIPEIAIAPNKATAKKIMQRLVEQVKRHETLEKVLSTATKAPEAPLTEGARAEAKLAALSAPPKPTTEVSVQDQQILYFARRCLHGTFEEYCSTFQDNSFDIVCFDPPWGVAFDTNKVENASQLDYDDSPETYSDNLEPWLRILFQKMKPDSHLYMFAAMSRIGFTYDTLEKVGFITHRIPIIWYKKGAHSVRAAHKWPAMCYEPICFVHKGGRKALVRQGQPSLIETPQPTPRIKGIHPSAKHPKVYRELLLRSAYPGDTILDPMGGSGMFGVAAESLSQSHSLNWFMIEKEKAFYDLQIFNLLTGYETLSKEDMSITLPSIEGHTSFKGLTPGTEEWKMWWVAHPEEQAEMLKWRHDLKLGYNQPT